MNRELSAISTEEQEMLAVFRKLPESDRQGVVELVKSCYRWYESEATK